MNARKQRVSRDMRAKVFQDNSRQRRWTQDLSFLRQELELVLLTQEQERPTQSPEAGEAGFNARDQALEFDA